MGMYCGIDLGNKETAICIIDERRQVKLEAIVGTCTKELREVFKHYRKLTCIVEAAPLAEWLCKEVEACGHAITIVCPRKAKAVLSGHGKKKTDRRDAKALAELCKSEWYEPVHRKSDEARELRSFLAARKQLVESSTAFASSIRGILRAHGIRLMAGSDEGNFAEKARAAAQELPPKAREGIEELVAAYEMLHWRQRAMYKALRNEVPKHPETARLVEIPGVGPATATAFVATIDDPMRFQDGESVASYVGLTPSVYQSGETEYRGRITKNGDKLLRWLLVEAAHILLTRSNTSWELKKWGLNLQAKKGVGKARVAVARRLCVMMWKIWRDQLSFNPEAGARLLKRGSTGARAEGLRVEIVGGQREEVRNRCERPRSRLEASTSCASVRLFSDTILRPRPRTEA